MEMLQGVWKQHLRPRAVVGYGVKIFLPSPPNYVTTSPGSVYMIHKIIHGCFEIWNIASHVEVDNSLIRRAHSKRNSISLRAHTLFSLYLQIFFPAIIYIFLSVDDS